MGDLTHVSLLVDMHPDTGSQAGEDSLKSEEMGSYTFLVT